jgi:hypothetical protein
MNNFKQVMSQKSDAELLKIISAPTGDYQPLALEAAKLELEKRNLTVEELESAKIDLREDEIYIENKANLPLGFIWKVIAFLLPGLLLIFISGGLRSEGYKRKAKELVRWTIYGLGFYIGWVIIVMLTFMLGVKI